MVCDLWLMDADKPTKTIYRLSTHTVFIVFTTTIDRYGYMVFATANKNDRREQNVLTMLDVISVQFAIPMCCAVRQVVGERNQQKDSRIIQGT